MQGLKILMITNISIGSNHGHVMDEAAKALWNEGFKFELICADSKDLNEDILLHDRILKSVERSELILIRVHGDVSYYKKFNILEKVIQSSECSVLLECGSDPEVTLRYRYMFKQSDEEYRLLLTLLSVGGDVNNKSVLLWALKTFNGVDVHIPEPIIPMAQGIYVTGKEPIHIERIRDFLDFSKHNICIMFHQSSWLTGNTQAIDKMIQCVIGFGDNPIAVFTSTHEDNVTGSIGIRNLIDNYFLKDGESIIDCVIQTMGFSQTLTPFPGEGTQVCNDNFFERLDIPIIQSIILYGSSFDWKNSVFGLSGPEIAGCVVNPEFDGQIISVPFAGYEKDQNGKRIYIPIEDRCERIAGMAHLWSNLRNKSNYEKKVAVLLYMYPPREDLAGAASGLDTMESISELLKTMAVEGYRLDWVPENGKEIVKRLMDGVTNDNSWISDQQIEKRSVDLVTTGQYQLWFDDISDHCKDELIKGWGKPPGKIHTVEGKLILPGIINGNVFIGFQPDRGKTNAESYHDADNSPPHQYLAFYRWLKNIFKMDAIIHMGTHGSLEWLPGKSLGLSKDCFPDTILESVPNIYPYIIDNPGEGMQAKRRSYAVVTTHMIPSMTRAESYEKMEELESVVQSYMAAKSYKEKEKLSLIQEKLYEVVKKLSIFSDIGLSADASPEEIGTRSDEIYDYVLEVKDALINDGLHILGDVPRGKRLAEMIYSLTRYDNSVVPSLRISIAETLGYDFNLLLKNPSGTTSDGMLNGEIINDIDARSYSFIESMLDIECDKKGCLLLINENYPENNDNIVKCVDFICNELYVNVLHMKDEILQIIHALNGGFIPSGPSGCPTRGRAQILPTGRNFYSIDPDGIPWNSSWEIGKKMATDLVNRYVDEHGEYPKSLGIVVWATDTMRTGGDDISYVLWLMGLRPVWSGYGGRVIGLEVVPISELGRPRVDVTLRISGLFRDAFPNLVVMIDEGVQTIGSLDESDDDNYLAANLRKDIIEAIDKGMTVDEAHRLASIRVFSNAPGQYGGAVNDLITTKDWKNIGDLGNIYLDYGCFGYGKGLSGQAFMEQFRKRIGSMDVTVKNHNNRECDLFDCDDDYDFLGGMNAAVRSVRGKKPMSVMGDSSDMQNIKLRTLEEECRFVFRSKINNPKWLEGLKEHGFRGAQELSSLFDYIMGWDATSDVIEDWMYQSVTDNFLLDQDTKEWIKDENPYALIAMLDRLQEAMNRDMWDPDNETKEKLKELFLETEERLEEITDRYTNCL